VCLLAGPLLLAVVLFWHPAGGVDVYEGVRQDIEAWKFVHTAFLLLVPLLGLTVLHLLHGVRSGAATISRVGLLLFLVFYTAYEVTVGVGTGILVDYAHARPADEQAVMADAIQHYNHSGIVGDPVSVSLVVGFGGWVVAMVAAAVALHRAGAGRMITALAGGAALFAIHPPPIGSAGLVCLAAAALLVERDRGTAAVPPVLPIAATSLDPADPDAPPPSRRRR
jgi:hypothetical protein